MLSKRGSQTNDVSDKRGKAQPANKKDCETSDLVNHHILGYNPSISHYQRSHAPNRLYISPEHNISALFKDVCSRYEDVKISYAYYYKKVKKMNISFVKFGEEECERCDLHDKQLEVIQKLDKHELSKPDENGKNRKPTSFDCADCADFELHIKTAAEAREIYREKKNREWTDNKKVGSVDMQKVIMLPRLPGLKVVVFCKRIVVFNKTLLLLVHQKMERIKQMVYFRMMDNGDDQQWMYQALSGRVGIQKASSFG